MGLCLCPHSPQNSKKKARDNLYKKSPGKRNTQRSRFHRPTSPHHPRPSTTLQTKKEEGKKKKRSAQSGRREIKHAKKISNGCNVQDEARIEEGWFNAADWGNCRYVQKEMKNFRFKYLPPYYSEFETHKFVVLFDYLSWNFRNPSLCCFHNCTSLWCFTLSLMHEPWLNITGFRKTEIFRKLSVDKVEGSEFFSCINDP